MRMIILTAAAGIALAGGALAQDSGEPPGAPRQSSRERALWIRINSEINGSIACGIENAALQDRVKQLEADKKAADEAAAGAKPGPVEKAPKE